jgi:hypothetical protein
VAQEHEERRRQERQEGVVAQVGPIEIDWPRALGYYGGIGVAVAMGMVEPPLAVFIAAVPLFKMLNRPQGAKPTRVVAEILEGAATPVGGSAESMIWLKDKAGDGHRIKLLADAREVATRHRARRQRQEQPAAS